MDHDTVTIIGVHTLSSQLCITLTVEDSKKTDENHHGSSGLTLNIVMLSTMNSSGPPTVPRRENSNQIIVRELE
jgi:hypothetical protein